MISQYKHYQELLQLKNIGPVLINIELISKERDTSELQVYLASFQ